MNDLDFSYLKRTEIPVKIGNRNFIITEPNTGSKNKYRNTLLKSAKADENGKIKFFENLADTETLLISICLMEKVGDKELSLDNPEGIAFLNSLDARITSKLYKACKEVGDKEEENAKEQETKEEAKKETETKEEGREAKKN